MLTIAAAGTGYLNAPVAAKKPNNNAAAVVTRKTTPMPNRHP